MDEIKMAYEDKIKLDINQEFAKRVARNLYNYLDSFNQVIRHRSLYLESRCKQEFVSGPT